MDEVFVPLNQLLPELIPNLPDIYDADAGVRTRITGYEVATPIELGVVVMADGSVELGGTPPVYHLPTSIEPVFHAIALVIEREGAL
jgi:hypothetical protein